MAGNNDRAWGLSDIHSIVPFQNSDVFQIPNDLRSAGTTNRTIFEQRRVPNLVRG